MSQTLVHNSTDISPDEIQNTIYFESMEELYEAFPEFLMDSSFKRNVRHKDGQTWIPFEEAINYYERRTQADVLQQPDGEGDSHACITDPIGSEPADDRESCECGDSDEHERD